ncbi:hypothetical protein MNBD_BACTEROID06-1372 [hydrothermal vent metagenome]|uniref:Transposase IS4-like domain-containing protein n=1 Tax=hydrothermal vent metagenome TaxID=652676 RepID=A0A3B0VC99_9ZZZZ
MNNPATVYQYIIAPMLPLLQKEVEKLKKDNYRLSLKFFTLNLCYSIIACTRSIRLLITEAKTNDIAISQGIIVASSSMYSDAFIRYNPIIFKRIFFGLLEKLKFKEIPEIKSLGRFILVDGSILPAIKSMTWARYKKTANGIKLHLAFELNRMIPIQFFSTDANGSEKEMLRELLEEGVTYIADRGYVAFDLFKQITEQSAFFIIRVKSNMDFTVKQSLTIDLPEKWKKHLSDVKDYLIVFKGDNNQKIYRIITFEALGESYRIATNRLDLKTHEIIMLYAYRWQIELFFRCFKRCFNGLHLWSHEAKGIEIQFYLHMIVYLLLMNFKQGLYDKEEALRQEEKDRIDEYKKHSDRENEIISDKPKKITPKKGEITRTPACGIVTLLGEKLKTIWKIGIHWLTAVRNMLAKPMTKDVIRILNSS